MQYVHECSLRSWEIYFKQRILEIPIPPTGGNAFPLRPFIHGSEFRDTFKRDNEIQRLEEFLKKRIVKTGFEEILRNVTPAVLTFFLPQTTTKTLVDLEKRRRIAQDIKRVRKKLDELLTAVDDLRKNNTFNYLAEINSNYSIHETELILSSFFRPRSKSRKHEALIGLFHDLPILMPWHGGTPLISSIQNLTHDVLEGRGEDEGQDHFKNGVLNLYKYFLIILKKENSKGLRPVEELPFEFEEMYLPESGKKSRDPQSHLAMCLTLQFIALFRFEKSSLHESAIKIINTKVQRNDGLKNVEPINIDYDLFESRVQYKAFQQIPIFNVNDKLSGRVESIFKRMRISPPTSLEDLRSYKSEIDKIVEASEHEVFERIEMSLKQPALNLAGLRAAFLNERAIRGLPLSVDSYNE